MSIKKTQEQFVNELEKVNPEIKVLGNYTNSGTKILCKCNKCGHEWMPIPRNILRGSKCPKCTGHYQYTAEDLQNWLSQNVPSIVLADGFVNISTKALFHCKKCGNNWQTRPADIKQGSRCPNCYHKYPTEKKDVENELQKKYITLTEDFTYISAKATMQCNICGHKWRTRVLDVLKGSGCPKCNKHYSPTPSEFSEWMIKNKPTIYLRSDYVKSNVPVECQCKICRKIWHPTPAMLKRGTGCPVCGIGKAVTSRVERAGTELLSTIQKTRPDITILEKYKGSQKKIMCRCNVCGREWRVQPISIQQGHGCPNCAKTSTSYMEQFLYHSFCMVMGKDNVLLRNKDIIGKELDIVIPSYSLAIELGAWNWHKNRVRRDIEKYKLCQEKGIRLLTIYDSFYEENKPMNNALTFQYDLASEENHSTLKDIVNGLLAELKVERILSEQDFQIIESLAKENSRKMNTETFRSLLENINPNIVVIGEYYSNNTPIECECRICGHTWKTRPADLKNGRGCPVCANKQIGLKIRVAPQDFAKWMEDNKPTIEQLEPYQTAVTPIKTRCKICGYTWMVKPCSLKRGTGCPNCANNNRRHTHQEFTKWMSENRPNISIVNGVYQNNRTRMLFSCKKCGYQWESCPQNIKNKRSHGCPKCGNK